MMRSGTRQRFVLPFYRLAGSATDMMFLQGYTVFSIPVGVVYRPNEAKVRNLQQKDYLGKARLVAASDRSNAFTGFAGTELNKGVSPGLFSSDTFLSKTVLTSSIRPALLLPRTTGQPSRCPSPPATSSSPASRAGDSSPSRPTAATSSPRPRRPRTTRRR